MYDALSVPERKNPAAAIEAFLEATRPGDIKAHLVIKVSNLDKTPAHATWLRGMVEGHDNMSLVEGYLDRDSIYSLIQSCDAFLSLHRAEGFGLGLAEAMLLGKVCIATGWSGNLQFMSPDNSMLVGCDVVELERDYGPYAAGGHWADPNVAEAAAAIRGLCLEPGLGEALGKAGRNTIAGDFSAEAVGAQVMARLVEIAEQSGIARAG